MKEKSEGIVLAVDLQDPNTTHGMVEVLKNYNNYAHDISECGNVRQKMVVNGIKAINSIQIYLYNVYLQPHT